MRESPIKSAEAGARERSGLSSIHFRSPLGVASNPEDTPLEATWRDEFYRPFAIDRPSGAIFFLQRNS